MVSVPYLSLGTVSFLIYRGCKKNAAYYQALENNPVDTPLDPADSMRSSAGLDQ